MSGGREGDEDGELVMTYPDGSVARIKVPASAICEHKSIRELCPECAPPTDPEAPDGQ